MPRRLSRRYGGQRRLIDVATGMVDGRFRTSAALHIRAMPAFLARRDRAMACRRRRLPPARAGAITGNAWQPRYDRAGAAGRRHSTVI